LTLAKRNGSLVCIFGFLETFLFAKANGAVASIEMISSIIADGIPD
jgi:hypothetical protein